MTAELTSLLSLSPNRAGELDQKLGKAMTALCRLNDELLALSGSERKAAVTFAPEGCPDLRTVIRQLCLWRAQLYGCMTHQLPQGTEKPRSS
jgi:hypothetical protein